MSNDTEPAPRSALVDEIASQIRARIMSGEIAIGAQLRQAELANELGVSRTPIREALRQLQTSGLIEVVPNRGAVVRVPVPWEVREAYQVRAQLEGFATELAVKRISDAEIATLREANETMREATVHPPALQPGEEPPTTTANDVFHTTIHQASGNQRLARTINEINETFPRNVSWLVLRDDQRHREQNVREHERILEAIVAGDGERARREMVEHVVGAGEHLARWYERRSATVFVG
ncbi:Transcriptional regulator GntR family [Patulibacter medicamentivorans]|uniref:Transcriptional regulator GntR family n=1 Tax=Patulibacter medicamentivorans TaxID=1097667 RepID=H0E324_9ACTN|nr:GntR family transcriptional regulator [Patulibacter medicamentivorans]EHN11933.1 Transcriptional regulator GntR family [Patulibacter medicamentivorans]